MIAVRTGQSAVPAGHRAQSARFHRRHPHLRPGGEPLHPDQETGEDPQSREDTRRVEQPEESAAAM